MIENNLKILVTPVYLKNHQLKQRIIVNQGGSRSSKTYSIAQLFIMKSFEVTGKTFTICRKTLPALKATAMRDFFEILNDMGLHVEKDHNKTENLYKLNGNLFEFLAVDEQQKVRGRKRDYLWMNEANEFKHEDFKQLSMRTTTQIFLDYNPSDEFHWIYDKVLTRKDCVFIKSTYLDNPFLELELVKEIESYKLLDPNYWKIYGLGERGMNEAGIYSHFTLIDDMPENLDEEIYGLDFGFNNASSLERIGLRDQNVFTENIIYKKHLTNSDLIDEMDKMGVSKEKLIYADAAEPQRIQEIKEAGYWIVPADKSQGSVKKGIDTMKSRAWSIVKTSLKTIKEAQSYKWKVKDEKILDEPVKVNDHSMDAIRYAVHTHSIKSFIGVL